MNPLLEDALLNVVLEPPQTYRGVTIFPLRIHVEAPLSYLPLARAISDELLTVAEIDTSGSVPELRVINRAGIPVLILDGEELMGAKQNRVINTTVLLREESETIIPVSCTEQGRWDYTSPRFEDSDVIMAREARSRKNRSVSESLKSSGDARSDQQEVWEEISNLEQRLGTHSPTAAMRDSYQRVEKPLHDFLSEFPCVENQTGLIALANGEVIGLDLLSSASAYRHVHEKLVKSYVIDLLGNAATENEPAQEIVAREFLGHLASLTESVHPSVGYGTDLRYQSDTYCGSALIHEDALIHAAFFVETKASSGRRHFSDTDIRYP